MGEDHGRRLRKFAVGGLVALAVLAGCETTSKKPFASFESGLGSTIWKLRWKGKAFEDTVSIQQPEDRRFGFEPALNGQAGAAICVTIPAGEHKGTHELEYNFAAHGFEDPEEATASYLMRLGDDFCPAESGKFPGFAGTYGQAGFGELTSNGYNGWSARSMFYASPKCEPLRVASLCYLANMQERGGRSTFFDWHTAGVPRLERDRWYHIVQHVKMNSVIEGKAQADGVLQVWVDGKRAVDQREVVFRYTDKLKIDRMWFDVYYGGDVAPATYHVFFDEIIVHSGPPGAYQPNPTHELMFGDEVSQPPIPSPPKGAPKPAPKPVPKEAGAPSKAPSR